jgi:branched-chain amino acid aminotransferase
MIAYLNGKFLDQTRAVVSVFDRGFLYGDGLFETIRIFGGRPFRWDDHWTRLKAGAEFLKIPLPFGREKLRAAADGLALRNRMPDSILRLALSRGPGARGYSPATAGPPTLAMTLHKAPAIDPKKPIQWKLIVSSIRLRPNDPLARFKTANKLPQILARAEADALGADEALLANTNGFAAEGTAANLFWIEGDAVCTPPISAGILPGVTRRTVREICQTLKIRVREKNIRLTELSKTDGIFLTLTSLGIAVVTALDGTCLRQSRLTDRIASAYVDLLLQGAPGQRA